MQQLRYGKAYCIAPYQGGRLPQFTQRLNIRSNFYAKDISGVKGKFLMILLNEALAAVQFLDNFV